jgi:hypothetical protein
MLVTALWANQQPEVTVQLAADILCQDLQRKLTGQRPSDRYFRDCSQLADRIIEEGFPGLDEAPRADILMRYENKQ